MPRGKNSTRKETVPVQPRPKYACAADAPWGGFLNARLDDARKDQFSDWFDEKASAVWTSLDEALAEGLKFSLAYDPEHEAYVATLTGRLCLSLEQRWAASARAGTWETACALILFKHYILAEGNWDDFRPSKGDFLKWG